MLKSSDLIYWLAGLSRQIKDQLAMEECALCHSPAAYTCQCSAGPLPLCLPCLDSHTDTPGAHTLRKLHKSPSTQETFLRMQTGYICQICKTAIAASTCSCAFPLPLMCVDCRPEHMAQEMYVDHCFLPLSLYSQVKDSGMWEGVRDKLEKLGEVEEAVRGNLREMALCGEAIEKKYSELRRKLDEAKRGKLEKLAKTKQLLVSGVAKTIEEFQANVLQGNPPISSLIAHKIQTFLTSAENTPRLKLFSFNSTPSEDIESLEGLFDVTWESALEGPESKQIPALAHIPAQPKPQTCISLLDSMKTLLSVDINELAGEKAMGEVRSASEPLWNELKSQLLVLMQAVSEGKYSEFIQSAHLSTEAKSRLSASLHSINAKARGKAAWLAVGELLFIEERAEHFKGSPSALAYKKTILEALESSLDSVFLLAQLKRASSSSSRESKEKQLLADLQVLESSPQRPSQSSAAPPISYRQSLEEPQARQSISLSQVLEMKKSHFSEESVRNLEKTVMSTHETLHLFFKVLVAQRKKSMPFETIDRLVGELVPSPNVMQFIPVGNGECLSEVLRRHPNRSVNPFHRHSNSYDSPEDLTSFLLRDRSISNLTFSLLLVHSGKITSFDCRSHSYSTLPLNPTIRADSKSSYVSLPVGNLIVCGGTWQKAALADCYEVNPSTQLTVRLPDMEVARSLHGLVYYYTAVYAFGGMAGKALKSCEKLTLTPPYWTALPDLISTRSAFNPCEFQDHIYIVGGNQADGEVFDPLSETFAPLNITLPEITGACLFRAEEEFVLLTTHNTVRWGRDGELTSNHKKLCAWANTRPVVYGTDAYFPLLDCTCLPEKKCVQQISLKSGSVLGYSLDE